MQPVCSVPEEVWSLRVVCDCRAKNPELLCTSGCMHQSLTAMGISVHLGSRDVLVHVHPNALGKQRNLKMGIPLQSYWATTRRRVTNTFIGALCNALSSVVTWGGFLLSLVAWLQLAILSQYPLSVVRSAMICAAIRVLARMPWVPPNGGVDMFCFRVPAPGYVVFSFRSVGLAAQNSGVEDGFVCVMACTPRGALH